MSKFSFCESITAGGDTPWHIRKLTKIGQKFGGGADTKALCGREVSWDLDVEITNHHLTHCCKFCMQYYREYEQIKNQ